MTNPYFNHTTVSEDQELLQDLVDEMIFNHGIQYYYLPRKTGKYDKLLGEDPYEYYDSYYPIDMYLENVMGFAGDREFLSKFAGVEVRDQIFLSVSDRVFESNVAFQAGITRPQEGDLIYFPLNQHLFKVHFAEPRKLFYQLGTYQTWYLTCEQFQYSGEKFTTGIAVLDKLSKDRTLDLVDHSLKAPDGSPLVDENGEYITVGPTVSEIDPSSDNEILTDEEETHVDFSEENPYSEEDYA